MDAARKARILSEALPYIRAFHGKTLVIRFGGAAMADAALKDAFARDVALLRLVGMKPIVVHGGGWRIEALMRKMGLDVRRHRGHRVTDERALTVVEMALAELNQELVSLVNRHGGRAVGIDGQDGRFIHARPLAATADGPDLGYLGDVEDIDTGIVEFRATYLRPGGGVGVQQEGRGSSVRRALVLPRRRRRGGCRSALRRRGMTRCGRSVSTCRPRAPPPPLPRRDRSPCSPC